jgi:hypothetical protein
MSKLYSETELQYLKTLANKHKEHSLARLARLAMKNSDRSYCGLLKKLRLMVEKGELWD